MVTQQTFNLSDCGFESRVTHHFEKGDIMLSIVLCIFGSIFEILAAVCFYLAIKWREDTDKFPYHAILFLGSGCCFVGLVYFIVNASLV